MDHRRLYVIHTYEQKLIWTDFQRMTTLIGKLEPFSGDAYQSSPNFKLEKLIKKKSPVYASQGGCMWYIHMNRNWFGLISKGWLH